MEQQTPPKKFSIMQRFKSFVFAFSGLKILVSEEHNAIVHIAATICVIIAGFLLHISAVEWIAVILCSGTVIALEAVNSAIENICNFVYPQKHKTIKKTKDLAAAAVLIAAICAAVVGLIIFIPKIINLFLLT